MEEASLSDGELEEGSGYITEKAEGSFWTLLPKDKYLKYLEIEAGQQILYFENSTKTHCAGRKVKEEPSLTSYGQEAIRNLLPLGRTVITEKA